MLITTKYNNLVTKEAFGNRIKQFILRLIRFLDCLPNETTSRVIKDQLMRSGSSIGANYFESKAASSKNDFVNFFFYSLKSANESKFWLEILIDLNKGDIKEARALLQELIEISNIFGSSILTLKGRK
ncbi:MAG: four helix bundle protein [Candidatus Omnitrophica bacterium]|nr:four helix bundle protein [Candidatus Omnitrophota bacterium]